MGLVHVLLESRGLGRPDGRPLYAYKLSDAEFDALMADLRRRIDGASQFPLEASDAFCLFGAEYHGRGEGDDWWRWDGIKQALGATFADQQLREATQRGLRYWGRRLHLGPRGIEYLATLVIEGGLPLKLLSREGARLRRYFAELLRQHETYSTRDLLDIAREVAESDVLPRRMQNTVVYELAATLVRAVARLRRANLSVDALTSAELPLRLDHTAARDLVDGLKALPRARAADAPRIRVRTSLARGETNVLSRVLTLPTRVPVNWMADLLAAWTDARPPRLSLSLVVADGSRQTVGFASLQGDEYLLVRTAARPIVRPELAREQLRLELALGETALSFVPARGEALPDTPWIFEDTSEAVLLATGPYASSARSLLVALPARGSYDAEGLEPLGAVAGHDRSLVRLHGVLFWRDDGDEVLIEPSANRDGSASEDFVLKGKHLDDVVRDRDIWLGCPRVYRVDEDGSPHGVDPRSLEWRRAGSAWSRDVCRAVGNIELRGGGEAAGFRARVRVAPDDLRVGLHCAGTRGAIQLRSGRLQAAAVEHANATTRPVAGGIDLDVEHRAGPVAALRTSVQLTGGAELSFTVASPCEFAGFFGRGGVLLPPGSCLSLDELAHVRAASMSPQPGRWALDVISNRGREPLATLREVQPGVCELSLEPLRRALSLLLSAADELDEAIQIALTHPQQVRRRVPYTIRRYDAVLEPNHVTRTVALERDAIERFGPEIVASLRTVAVPLNRPAAMPVSLAKCAEHMWSTAYADTGEALDAGNWLVLTYQNDYLRTRPLRVHVAGPEETPSSTLDDAMSIRSPERRREQLERYLLGLPGDLTEWERVKPYFDTLGAYPAATFDVVRVAATQPLIAVLALLHADRFARVWDGFEELPFSSFTISVNAWLAAIKHWSAQACFAVLSEEVKAKVAVTVAPELFGPLKRAPFLESIHEVAHRQRLPLVPAPSAPTLGAWDNPLSRTRFLESFRGERDAFLARHADDVMPTEPADSPVSTTDVGDLCRLFDGQPAYKRPALEAPLVVAAAAASSSPIALDPIWVRRARDFDVEWFDFAHSLGLSHALARRLARKEIIG